MLRSFAGSYALMVALGIGVASACTGTFYRLRGEETEPGVFNVQRTLGLVQAPGFPDTWTTIGVSRLADLKAHLDSSIRNNNLVFIGRIDSVLGDGLTNVVSPPGLIPEAVLWRGHSADTGYGRFYARIFIDTLIKGSLPSKRFWFEGYGYGSSCNVLPMAFMGSSFLNFSDDFTSMQDLKMPMYSDFCVNCPTAHWFDGRYLHSPQFPVLRLDIREVLSGYPVGLVPRRSTPMIPLRLDGRAYRPDGRTVPGGAGSDRKSPVPLFR